MHVATKIGKESFFLFRKMFLRREIYQKYLIKNTVKLSFCCLPNISTLISWVNSKKLMWNKNTEPPNWNCIKKENCPLKGRSQIQCVVYKAEALNPNSNSNNRNDKKCMWVQCKTLSNKDITIIKSGSLMKYIDIKLVCPIKYGKSRTNLV